MPVLDVIDDGEGISGEDVENVFEPFFTTESTGTGLGLYISRELCEVNQAELTVDSTLGVGTRFHIRLALARSAGNNGA